MSQHADTDPSIKAAKRLPADQLLRDLARYVVHHDITSDEAYQTAMLCLIDSMGCGLLALNFPECKKMLGPVVPGATLPGGCRVPGTAWQLDPVQAAFNIGTMIRWLDFNDTWLAAEWGHPSDNFGAILAAADYVDRCGPVVKSAGGLVPGKITVRDVLTAAIKAYEIQGVLALENSYNRHGMDHVILVRVASAAVVTSMLGGSEEDVVNVLSHAWLDGGALRTYRHAPNTGPRKSWAAGDATSRAVRLALFTLAGEMGYPTALSAPKWGFYDVLWNGEPFTLGRSLDSYVMENILFKISFPAEFHAQTAVEAAIQLHPSIKDRLDSIEKITIDTHESAVRIIDKTGPLHNPADRDHCLQYMTAIGLLFGELKAEHYEDDTANDPRVDALRDKMVVQEVPGYSKDYLDPDKRSIANRVQVFFKDGTSTDAVEVEYPLGHRRRRDESRPHLYRKFEHNIATQLSQRQCQRVQSALDPASFNDTLPLADFIDLFVVKS